MLAALRSSCSLAQAVDGNIMHCGIIGIRDHTLTTVVVVVVVVVVVRRTCMT